LVALELRALSVKRYSGILLRIVLEV